MKKILILAWVCMMHISCKQNKAVENEASLQYKGDTVFVSSHSVVSSKIKTYTLAQQDYSSEFNTTGTVKAIAGQMAEIAPPFDGRVARSFVQLGQRVSAGSPVFELHSADFFEATKAYFQSLQTRKTKELSLQRQRDLLKNGVGVAKDLEEAETDYEVALKDYENAAATLKMFNIDPDDIAMGQALKVTSPISGEVVQANIVIGQYVKSEAAPLLIVAELGKVWTVAQVKEKYIHSIHTDDKVEVRTDSEPENAIAGYVSHISELLDEETRSVQVLVTCDNKDRRLKPGMFASVRFINQPHPSILVPSTALLQKEDETYVFVKAGEGEYIKRRVKAATASASEALITEGLASGDVIVSEGAIYLMMN